MQHYSGPKIIVAKLAKQLESFFDDEGHFAGLNVNFVFAAGQEAYFYLGQMNSVVASWMYRQLFGALSMAGDYMQFQAPQLRALPVVPYRSEVQEHAQLAGLARVASTGRCTEELLVSIDAAVAAMLRLSDEDLHRIQAETPGFATRDSTS